MFSGRMSGAFLSGIILFILTIAFITWSAAALTNGRQDQLVLIHHDRAGGAPEVTNGRGEQAFVTINWVESKTLTNNRGEILETGAYITSLHTAAVGWDDY